MVKYMTPSGTVLDEDDLDAEERHVCDVCNTAVIEDEYLLCPRCETGHLCLYCFASGCFCVECYKKTS